MNNNAQKKLIKSLSTRNSIFCSEAKLYKLYVKFTKEVNQNIERQGEFNKAYLYLKDIEFEFTELKKGYYHPSQFPKQLSFSFLENEPLKKIYLYSV